MDALEERLRALVKRHEEALAAEYPGETGAFHFPAADLYNVLEPGSAPMYPAEVGWVATCHHCAPDGDGHSRRPRKAA